MTKDDTPKPGDKSPKEGGDENVTLTKEEHDGIVSSLAESKQAIANLVSEIKELRQKRDPHEDEKKSETDKIIEAKLAEREARETEKNRKSASERIIQEIKVLTDPKIFAEFEKALAKINFSEARSIEDFTDLYNDALNLAGIERPTETIRNPYSSTPRSDIAPKGTEPTNLSMKEQAFVKKHFNGDEKAYLAQKEKRPEYINTLLEFFKQ